MFKEIEGNGGNCLDLDLPHRCIPGLHFMNLPQGKPIRVPDFIVYVVTIGDPSTMYANGVPAASILPLMSHGARFSVVTVSELPPRS